MARTSIWYRAGLQAARHLVPLATPLSPKLKQGHAGRLRAVDLLRRWADAARDPRCPLVWFHASSVGEGLQAAGVLEALRRRHPDWQYAFTHFSPSASELAKSLPVDIATYLPYDVVAEVEAALEALQPSAVVFTKLDLWAELACRAGERGSRVMLVAGTVRSGSSRLRWPARTLLRSGYQAVTLAGAIADEDAARLERLGVPHGRIQVTGDPRYDSVAGRVAGVAPDDPLRQLGVDGPTMVAGSTWPEDERVLLASFQQVHQARPDAILIIAPHEPREQHLARLERAALDLGLPVARSSTARGGTSVLLIDRVGILPIVYGSGGMAYVGGAIGSRGIHSVLEPAAWGIPVVFGPRWDYSRDAGLLMEAGGARALGRRDPVADMTGIWLDWLENEETRRAQGSEARRVFTAGLGAADRTAGLIAGALRDDGPFDGHRPR
ncbi:MAG: glycosyltransferase N-terminal domain-containing protein [Gemmatimonadales bacterium]